MQSTGYIYVYQIITYKNRFFSSTSAEKKKDDGCKEVTMKKEAVHSNGDID